MTLTPSTPVPATGSAALAVGTGPALPIAGGGYVALDESEVVGRMLADDQDITVLAHTLRDAHLLDASGPLLSAFTRLDGLMEAAAIEIRMIRNLLGGA
jgi:hypothetical protein